ncbi:nuclear transport factor 2 family protein [Vibrio sp. Isolate31]|uniref:nuclear transport factor 2 family protein n=1 Tax=unclassified Vibrio TaxID=2614977 RepID=UPI001EFCE449|nr:MULTISPECIES: nuclear transport factor 2 family protein [unclassified Vibrio]MCG9552598.1 nuclear transport factor 2 family protein [Vibrio sp. Isolate32]MCG9602817.1 nuclear transport factor 2 family protein [Vibrio sp. Isolate31]
MNKKAVTQQQKIQLFNDAMQYVLAKHDVSRVADYFTDDAVIIINDRRLAGHQQICERLQWIKEHTSHVEVSIQRVFFDGDRGFDHHTSRVTSHDGNSALFKIFGYIEMRDNKISLYEDVTIQVEGENALHLATSVKQ